jgi:tripartite-type tricarboxylate transporter receptor subunit TctC
LDLERTPSNPDPVRRRVLGSLAGVAAAPLLGAPGSASAAAFPQKPVKLVVPFATGGATDNLARLIGRGMESALGQSVIVENRPGAAGGIGAAFVAKSDPDGLTMLMAGVGSNIVLNLTVPSTPYDAERDLQSVIYVCDVDYVMVVNAESKYRTLADLIGAARAKPGTLSYMSTGQNGPLHVGTEYLTRRAGVQMIHVPYKGEAPAYGDLISGRIDVAVMTVPFTKPQIAAGKLRPIATISAQRARGMPNVPTVAEQGFPGYAVPIWNGLSVPSGTPAEAMTVLNRAANVALRDPAIVQRMLELGVAPIGGAPADFAVMLRRERERWKVMIKESGIMNG